MVGLLCRSILAVLQLTTEGAAAEVYELEQRAQADFVVEEIVELGTAVAIQALLVSRVLVEVVVAAVVLVPEMSRTEETVRAES